MVDTQKNEPATGSLLLDSLEIRDLLDLLKLLDNPLQDIPLLGVLRSPLVGMTPADLAEVRLAKRDGNFWTALMCCGWSLTSLHVVAWVANSRHRPFFPV